MTSVSARTTAGANSASTSHTAALDSTDARGWAGVGWGIPVCCPVSRAGNDDDCESPVLSVTVISIDLPAYESAL